MQKLLGDLFPFLGRMVFPANNCHKIPILVSTSFSGINHSQAMKWVEHFIAGFIRAIGEWLLPKGWLNLTINTEVSGTKDHRILSREGGTHNWGILFILRIYNRDSCYFHKILKNRSEISVIP